MATAGDDGQRTTSLLWRHRHRRRKPVILRQWKRRKASVLANEIVRFHGYSRENGGYVPLLHRRCRTGLFGVGEAGSTLRRGRGDRRHVTESGNVLDGESYRAKVWYLRNGRVHDSVSLHDDDVIPWAESFLEEYHHVNDERAVGSGKGWAEVFGWIPPCGGKFMFNIDTAMDMVRGTVGISIMFVCDVGLWLREVEYDAQVVVNLVNEKDISCYEYEEFPPSLAQVVLGDCPKQL
ncbi:hypothetical protein Q3G72_022761 [Acer saccharum]|nr:hypothetical protein Q3G72_022761 [Acer saccharum]